MSTHLRCFVPQLTSCLPQVKLATGPSGETVAVKLMDRDAIMGNERTSRNLEREIEAMKRICHPNVMRLHAVEMHVTLPSRKRGEKVS